MVYLKTLVRYSVPLRPTAVFLMPSGSIGAGLIEQPVSNILPKGALAVEPDCIDLLDFDYPGAPLTLNAQYVVLYVGQRALVDRWCSSSSRTRVSEHRMPHPVRHRIIGCDVIHGLTITTGGQLAFELFHLFWFGHPPTRRSIRHAILEQNKNI